MLTGRKSGFRAGLRPESYRESFKVGHPAGLRPAGGLILKLSRLESGRNPARKPHFQAGSTIASHKVGEESGRSPARKPVSGPEAPLTAHEHCCLTTLRLASSGPVTRALGRSPKPSRHQPGTNPEPTRNQPRIRRSRSDSKNPMKNKLKPYLNVTSGL